MAAVMEERSGNRPRSKSAFSFKSDKSDKSVYSNGGTKTHIRTLSSGKETAEEKHRSHLSVQGKANPNAAMNEAQPIAAALEAPTIGSLRSIQHVDSEGNPIAEPDLSNPTRPRWERPLDTIRSFEAAIDGEFKRRLVAQSRPTTAMFSDSGVGFQSRRTSYFGVMDQYQQPQARYSQAGSQVGGYGGYYNRNRDSYAENGYGNGYGYNQMSPAGRPRHDRRQHSEPMANRYNNGGGQGVYPTPGYQQSRDTVNTGESNGSHSEPWTNSTDPSSENSSIDRANGAPKPSDPAEQYGYAGYGGTAFNGQPIVEEMPPYGEPVQPPTGLRRPENGPPNGDYRYQQVQNPHQSGAPPQPPPHSYSGNQPMPRTRNTLSKASHGPPPVPNKDGVQITARSALQTTPSQKKKSWLKRTFSKKE